MLVLGKMAVHEGEAPAGLGKPVLTARPTGCCGWPSQRWGGFAGCSLAGSQAQPAARAIAPLPRSWECWGKLARGR